MESLIALTALIWLICAYSYRLLHWHWDSRTAPLQNTCYLIVTNMLQINQYLVTIHNIPICMDIRRDELFFRLKEEIRLIPFNISPKWWIICSSHQTKWSVRQVIFLIFFLHFRHGISFRIVLKIAENEMCWSIGFLILYEIPLTFIAF